MGPVSIGVEVQRNIDGDTPSSSHNDMMCTFTANSLSDLVISVDDVYCGNVTDYLGDGTSVLVTCDTPLVGRTVKVTRGDNTLTMAEVELITIC